LEVIYHRALICTLKLEDAIDRRGIFRWRKVSDNFVVRFYSDMAYLSRVDGREELNNRNYSRLKVSVPKRPG
jgi:hypothetical protein